MSGNKIKRKVIGTHEAVRPTRDSKSSGRRPGKHVVLGRKREKGRENVRS